MGRSESRLRGHVTDTSICVRFEDAINTGVKPTLCIGSNLEENNAGNTEDVAI